MKKRKTSFFLFIFILSFFCSKLTAQSNKIVNWFTPQTPELSAQWGGSYPFVKDLRKLSPSTDFRISADFHEVLVDAGIQFQSQQIDVTNRVFYMPTFFNSFQAGLGINYHFYRYFKTFTEADLILSTRFRWVKGPVFFCEVAPGLLFKFASIDAIKKDKPVIYNFSYSFDLLCRWQIFQPAAFWCGLNFQDYFDYPLAISPTIKFGFDYKINPDIVFGIDYSLKYIDMFYSAVYLNESLLRLSFKVVL